jgi:hypothetical protein
VDRIEPIGPRPPQWLPVELDPDRETADERRRRQQRRKGVRPLNIEGTDPSTLWGQTPSQSGTGRDDDEPPRHVDVRA